MIIQTIHKECRLIVSLQCVTHVCIEMMYRTRMCSWLKVKEHFPHLYKRYLAILLINCGNLFLSVHLQDVRWRLLFIIVILISTKSFSLMFHTHFLADNTDYKNWTFILLQWCWHMEMNQIVIGIITRAPCRGIISVFLRSISIKKNSKRKVLWTRKLKIGRGTCWIIFFAQCSIASILI